MDLRQAWQERPCAGQYERIASCDPCQPSSSGTSTRTKELIRRQSENLAFNYPRHVPTLMFSALTAYEARDSARAAEHLDDVLQLQPTHAEAAVLRSRIAMEDGNLIYARRLLEEQVALRPDHAGVREAMASLRFLRGDYDEAMRTLDYADRLGCAKWRVEYNRGLIEERRGNSGLAAMHYRKALGHQPNWAPAAARLRALERGGA